MGILATSGCIFFVTLPFTEQVHKAMYAMWIWVISFIIHGTPVLTLPTSANCFGIENQTKNYGLIITGQAIGGLIMGPIASTLFPQLSYRISFSIVAGILAVSAIFAFFFPSSSSPRIILERLGQSPMATTNEENDVAKSSRSVQD